jgi:GTP-binding protein
MEVPPSKEALVAIVGRPNVGKSALFNRLVRRRVAIVHAQEGVTRDRLMATAEWLDRRFRVVDTGGLALPDGTASPDAIETAIGEQVRAALSDATAIVFVTDIRAGVVPLDREVAALLRRTGLPVVVAANKADSPKDELHAAEFESLGYPVRAVSAEHALGIDELVQALAPHLPPPGGVPEAEAERIRVAIIGRPNVGKSSFVNRLAGGNRLIVSPVAGTTRDAVEIPCGEAGGDGRGFLLVDTAGIRKAGKIKESVEKFSLFRATRSMEEADIACLVVDAVAGPCEQEKKLAGQVLENHKALVVLVNKWDLAKGQGVKEAAYEAQLRRALFLPPGIPVHFVSAKSGYRVRAAFGAISALAARLGIKLPTGILNRVIRDAFQRTQPPAARNRVLRFYYATQTGRRPPRITLFVNDPELSTPAHQTYLTNAIRRAFDLGGVPLVLRYRSSHEERSAGGKSPPRPDKKPSAGRRPPPAAPRRKKRP